MLRDLDEAGIDRMKLSYVCTPHSRSLSRMFSAVDVNDYCHKIWQSMDLQESFYVILLSTHLKVKGHVLISVGGIEGTVVEPIHIIASALLSNTKRIVLAHNHPSGATNPSKSDKLLTDIISKAADLFDINVIDHLIVTSENNYFSFADEGLLWTKPSNKFSKAAE